MKPYKLTKPNLQLIPNHASVEKSWPSESPKTEFLHSGKAQEKDWEDILYRWYFLGKYLFMEKTRKGVTSVDWQEKYVDKLDRDIADIKASLRDAKEDIKRTVDAIARSIDQSLGEMRERDNQRHAEILAFRTEINNNISSIRQDNAATRKWIIGMVLAAIGVSISTIIGIVTIILQVLGKG